MVYTHAGSGPSSIPAPFKAAICLSPIDFHRKGSAPVLRECLPKLSAKGFLDEFV